MLQNPMAYKHSNFSQRKLNSCSLYLCAMAFKISLVYVQSCEKKNPKQIMQHGPNFRSGNFEIIILDKSSLCRASHLVLIVAICRVLMK